jgi:hypothetical protein
VNNQPFLLSVTQNSVNGPSDRTSTICALLKGESLTAFDTMLEDVLVDPNPNVQALVPLTVDHIGQAIDSVATAVFPHCTLKIQKLWMNRGMRKPYGLSTCKTAAAITRINNSLPLFPLGNQDSKFTDQELVGLLKWSLPAHWRKKFDLDGNIPTLGTKAKLICECEAIERNKIAKDKEHKDDDNNNNNNNNKKNKFGKFVARAKKDDRSRNNYFYCENCGRNRTHDTSKCFFLKNKTQRFENKSLANNDNASKKDCPFSRRTFVKEVNTLARKASKKECPRPICQCTSAPAGQGIQGETSKTPCYRIRGFLCVQGFHAGAQLGKTYPSKEEHQTCCC